MSEKAAGADIFGREKNLKVGRWRKEWFYGEMKQKKGKKS
jgi:hypothetical protein